MSTISRTQQNDLISVVIPYWKFNDDSPKYLREALQSLVDQTHKDFEVIICLDCPDDDTLEETMRMAEEFPLDINMWVREGRETNVSATRNTAIKHARGDWFAFLDADNIWHKDWLRLMMGKAEEVFPDTVYSNAASDKGPLIYDNNLLKKLNYKPEHKVIGERHFYHYISYPTEPLFGTVLIHRNHLTEIGLFDPELKIYETSLMMVKLFLNFNVHIVREAFLYTRVWGGAVSVRGGHEKLVDYRGLFDEKAKGYKNEMEEIWMEAI